MVANLGNDEPPTAKRGARGLRRRRRRESALVWWAGFAVLLGASWWFGSWRLALITLLLWCLYQFLLVPTICRATTRQGFSCREPARGRLFACGSRHQAVKNDAVWRLAGLRNPFRRRPGDAQGTAAGGAGDDDGVLVASSDDRARLAQADRALILLATLGTAVTIVGMIYGF